MANNTTRVFVAYVPIKTHTKVFVTIAQEAKTTDTGAIDLVRKTSGKEAITADILRFPMTKSFIRDEKPTDLLRYIQNKDTAAADVWRNTGVDSAAVDMITIRSGMSWGTIDVERHVGIEDKSFAGIVRLILGSSEARSDVVRILSQMVNSLHPEKIEISLQKGTLSDVFNITVPKEVKIGDNFSGKVWDFSYNMNAYETDSSGLMTKVTGMYDVDQLLYTPFTYYSGSNWTAMDHAKAIAKMLGKHLDAHFDDFTPSDSEAGTGATIQNLAGVFFGWAGNLPHRWINVFLRGSTLHIIQRGQEPNTIDITGTYHTRPEVNRKLMRSVWSGRGSKRAHNQADSKPWPFSGTIIFGDAECSYSNGYLIHQVTEIGGKTETTSYRYDFDGYVRSKTVESEDYSASTSYTYADTGSDKYLATETTETMDKKTGDVTTTVVQHVYLGNGFYGAAHYTDGVLDASSVSVGKPGGKASQFTIDQSNLGLGGKKAKYKEGNSDNRFTSALFDTSFPIKNEDMLKKLTSEIVWLNRKIEETVTMDIWQYKHIIDFTDKVIYNGSAYSLESNQVSWSPTEMKQTVVLKRWY